MQTKFKRHQPVVLLKDPNPEYVEYHNPDEDDIPEVKIKKGMKGRINILLPNGQYHIEVLDSKGSIMAYCSVNEEDIEEI